MKRINLSIDLGENEIFEKEVEEVIRAKAREVVRNSYKKIIEEEAEREIERLFAIPAPCSYKDRLKHIVRNVVEDSIRKELNDVDINIIVREKTVKVIENKIESYSNSVDRRCKEVLEQKITESVEEKLKSILN